MVVELIVTLFVAQAATPPQEPIRVVPGAEPETKTMYRAVKQGEQRVEGLLRRIECPTGRPVSFMLQVKDKPMRVSAPTLTSVEYIAHRPDFHGPVTCGGKTPPDHVYLTYKSVDGAPRAVAIEFLPAR
jgi:hypothetical protein